MNVSLTDDFTFVDLFGNPKNKIYLEYLLECLFQKEPGFYKGKLEVEYEKLIQNKKVSQKRCRLDLVVYIKEENLLVNLEMYKNFSKNQMRKSCAYLLKIGNNELIRGKKYQEVKKIIQINFVEKVKSIQLEKELQKEMTNYPLTEMIEMEIIRLDMIDRVDYNDIINNRLITYLKFMKANSKKEREKIAKGSEILMNFNATIEEYIGSEEFYKDFDFQKGREEIAYNDGIDTGITNRNIEIIKAMLEEKYDIKEISKITKLPVDEIKKVQITSDLRGRGNKIRSSI